MIALTRLNGKSFVVNAEHIRYLELTPDTLVTLENGDKFMVKETLDDVVNRVIQYQRQIHAFTP
jgi:flagellar protein FlbD